VRIEAGKHEGIVGLVTWHGPDQYASSRYQSEAQLLLRDLKGREGFRIRVQPDKGQAFFTRAEYAIVLPEPTAAADPNWLDRAEADENRRIDAAIDGGNYPDNETLVAEDERALAALLGDANTYASRIWADEEAEREHDDPLRDEWGDQGTTTYYDEDGEANAIYVEGLGRVL
jgi:hypothetical protein